jgi:hypothetical protein
MEGTNIVRGWKMVRSNCRAGAQQARVERTLLSAAFDVDLGSNAA